MAIVRFTREEILKMPSRTDWERIRNMKDEDIDYSDIPETTDEWFTRAARAPKAPSFPTHTKKAKATACV
jgi:hypothetical protein